MEVDKQEAHILPILSKPKLDPFQQASLVSRLFFYWVFSLVNVLQQSIYHIFIKRGRKILLGQNDLYRVGSKDSANTSYERYNFYYQQYKGNQKWRVLSSLNKAFFGQICLTLSFFLIFSCLQLVVPLLSAWGTQFFPEDDSISYTLLEFLPFLMVQFFISLLQSILKPSYFFEQKMLGVHIQGALQTHIMKKTLSFPLQRSQIYKPGDLINLLQVDVYQVTNYYTNTFSLFFLPIQLGIVISIFIITVKKYAAVGISAAFLSCILAIGFGYIYGKVQNKFMHAKDLRMRSLDEMLLSVKQIKLNCLESFFYDRLNILREKELKQKRNQIILSVMIIFFLSLIYIGSFELTFLFADKVSLELMMLLMQNLGSLNNTVTQIPSALSNFIISKTSLQRVNLFLQQEEINQISYENNSNISISIQNGSFKWAERNIQDEETLHLFKKEKTKMSLMDQFAVKRLNFKIENGQFIAFVGSAGSGKSSILNSILNEMLTQNEQYTICGKLSLATQDPWILSTSVQENITYLEMFDPKKYNQVVHACGLDIDIQRMENSHQTVLGEKGDNLSGGQRKRINLARCIYRDAEIYLMDDPLSALDVKTRNFILRNCFLGYLKKKTRVLFANSIADLQTVDKIYLIENGEIIFQGNFSQVQEYYNSKLSTGEQIQEVVSKVEDFKKIEEDQQKDTVFDLKHLEEKKESQVLVPFEQKEDEKNLFALQSEDQQQGDIKSEDLRLMFKLYGGWFITFMSFFLTLIITAGSILTVASIAGLSGDDVKSTALVIFPLYQIPVIISATILQLLISVQGLQVSRKLHRQMIYSLLHASFIKFYNIILIGRLLNRLTKDIYNIDILLPDQLLKFSSYFSAVMTSLAPMMIQPNFYAIGLLVLYFIFVGYICYIYFRCLKEVTRIG